MFSLPISLLLRLLVFLSWKRSLQDQCLQGDGGGGVAPFCSDVLLGLGPGSPTGAGLVHARRACSIQQESFQRLAPLLAVYHDLPPSQWFLGFLHTPECNDKPASFNLRLFRVVSLECVTTVYLLCPPKVFSKHPLSNLKDRMYERKLKQSREIAFSGKAQSPWTGRGSARPFPSGPGAAGAFSWWPPLSQVGAHKTIETGSPSGS